MAPALKELYSNTRGKAWPQHTAESEKGHKKYTKKVSREFRMGDDHFGWHGGEGWLVKLEKTL